MTDKQKRELLLAKNKKHKELADDVADQLGHGDAKKFMEKTKSIVETAEAPANRNNVKAQMDGKAALKAAAEFTTTYLQLILYQEIQEHPNTEYMAALLEYFDDGVISKGNGKQYNNQLITGNDYYDKNKFVPTATNPVFGEAQVIKMFKDQAEKTDPTSAEPELMPNTFRYKKPISITVDVWQPFFMEGNLAGFVSLIEQSVAESYKWFKFDLLAKAVTSMKPLKNIVGTAPNLFEAMYKEILPEMKKMKTLSGQYSIRDTAYLSTTSTDEMIVFADIDVSTALSAGIQSQLFNAQLITPISAISPENHIYLGNKLEIGTSLQAITVDDATPYLEPTKIIVMKKNSIKFLTQIIKTETQAYAENLVIQVYLHAWATWDYLNWGQAFTYTNPNILKSPSES